MPKARNHPLTRSSVSSFVIRISSWIRGFGFRHSGLCIGLLLAAAISIGCDSLTPITPAQAIQLLNNPNRPDARREGIAALVTRWDFGKQPPYPAIYKKLAEKDPDVTVRAMAIRALNICRDKSATPIFIAGLKDDNEMIRLESCKALANVPDPAAIEDLIQVLSGTHQTIDQGEYVDVMESKDVRIAAADALRQYPGNLHVKLMLVKYLNAADFGVAWQCHQSLVALTGKDMNYDEAAWLKYLKDLG